MDKREIYSHYQAEVKAMRAAGTYKEERLLRSPQGGRVDTTVTEGVVNLCANNYLGLCDHPDIIAAAKNSYDEWGYGLSSVRFICGTTVLHKQLESRLSAFLGMEDTILYSSCFDANGGLFETLLGEEDAVISDELNHASIIDGIRLSKAERFRYRNSDMADLERCLKEAASARIRLIATDGVFSMDGLIAKLPEICDLADKYGALVMVDDSHAVGFMGEHGRGTHEYTGAMGRVDIITGTLGKAMGGASGGYTSASREVVDLLRQRSRPYLFSNSLAPSIVAASCRVLELLEESPEQRMKLKENTKYFRSGIAKLGMDVIESEHPIVAIMLYDAQLASRVAARLLELGVYVVGFSFPVVPKGKARIRAQVSAAHSLADLDLALAAFAQCKKEFGI